ncbi:hypothetical protein SPI_03865 [Niveomyces insectorum RCEF 264]|uniref:Uncharacterized protein n=1 Tax=Niveomyces insectorum RCEF 264 TaxID=1081102 RepID=A0A162J4R9_9HYPO|nr:hypothetical protein SPI_03865 [Niveomyces insectorum RCEF 264]
MDLDTIKKRISETMMSKSASASRENRKKKGVKTKTRDETIKELEEQRLAKEQAIGLMWMKLHDLRQQERDIAN